LERSSSGDFGYEAGGTLGTGGGQRSEDLPGSGAFLGFITTGDLACDDRRAQLAFGQVVGGINERSFGSLAARVLTNREGKGTKVALFHRTDEGTPRSFPQAPVVQLDRVYDFGISRTNEVRAEIVDARRACNRLSSVSIREEARWLLEELRAQPQSSKSF
jgi:hypothetical protein